MGRKTRVVTICDRHRGEIDAVATVEIVVDGERRQVDLCAEHFAEFRKTIKPWFGVKNGAASRATAARGGRKRATVANGEDATAIRAWAVENGYEVADRGRIPGALREAFAAARS